jgi:hypothetical protein
MTDLNALQRGGAMPIRPENRDRYPPEWPEISAAIRRRAGNACEHCGVANHALGGRLPSGCFLPALPTGTGAGADARGLTWPKPGDDGSCGVAGRDPVRLRIIRIVLTVAHLDHTPENCDPANLKCLCQRCHNRHDAAHRQATRRATAAAGQADLFNREREPHEPIRTAAGAPGP